MSSVAATTAVCVRFAGVRVAARARTTPGGAVASSRSAKKHASVCLIAKPSNRGGRSLSVTRAVPAEESPEQAHAVETEAPAVETPVEEPPTPANTNPDAAAIALATAEIKQYLKLLYVKREMNFNEVRLTLAIEDPRLADRRERYGIEDESGVSAEEKVTQLELINEGEIATDLFALETLLADFRQWPGLEEDAAAAARKAGGPSRYAEIANSASGIRGKILGQRVQEEEDEPAPEMDGNPFGFLALYGLSALPIFITIAALSIMFVNSLQ